MKLLLHENRDDKQYKRQDTKRRTLIISLKYASYKRKYYKTPKDRICYKRSPVPPYTLPKGFFKAPDLFPHVNTPSAIISG